MARGALASVAVNERDELEAFSGRASVAGMLSLSKVLVPVDFSDGSRVAIDYAVALAKVFRSEVTLFHVQELPGSMNAIVPGADNAIDAANEHGYAMHRLEALRVALRRDFDVEMPVVVLSGSPEREIVAYAVGGRFDMIVMGTHGRTGVKRVLMGSVAEAVVRRALCPVLTIHLPA